MSSDNNNTTFIAIAAGLVLALVAFFGWQYLQRMDQQLTALNEQVSAAKDQADAAEQRAKQAEARADAAQVNAGRAAERAEVAAGNERQSVAAAEAALEGVTVAAVVEHVLSNVAVPH